MSPTAIGGIFELNGGVSVYGINGREYLMREKKGEETRSEGENVCTYSQFLADK